MNAVDTAVVPPSSAPVTALEDVKSLLRKTTTLDDALLQDYTDAAWGRLQQLCLPLTEVTVTDTFDGSGTAEDLVLSTFPVTSVTSVTIYGFDGTAQLVVPAGGATGVTLGYRVNKQAGMISRVGSPYWPNGAGNIAVTYTAGPTTTPPEVVVALKLYVQTMWDTRAVAGNMTRPGQEPEQPNPDPVLDVPAEVVGIMTDWLKPPRIA